MDWCTDAIVNKQRQDAIAPCKEFAAAKKEAADKAAAEAAEAEKAALEAAKKAEEEAAAAEDGVTDAYTAKVETGAKSVDEIILEKEAEYQMVKLALGKDKENTELQKRAGTLKSEIQIMKDQLEAAKAAEREANPAAAAAEAEALARKERQREEAQRLPDDIRLAILEEVDRAFNAEDFNAQVKAVVEKYKQLKNQAKDLNSEIKGSNESQDRKNEVADAFERSKKSLKAVREHLKMLRDNKAALIRAAEEAAEKEKNKAFKVELSLDQQLAIADKLAELTAYEETDDPDVLKERQEAALDRAKAYRKAERKIMKER